MYVGIGAARGVMVDPRLAPRSAGYSPPPPPSGEEEKTNWGSIFLIGGAVTAGVVLIGGALKKR